MRGTPDFSRRAFCQHVARVVPLVPFTSLASLGGFAFAEDCKKKQPSQAYLRLRLPKVDWTVVEDAYKRVLRPMDDASPRRWSGDTKFLGVLTAWLKQLKLGGNTYRVALDPKTVFQASSSALGINTYMVMITDPALLSKIVSTSVAKDPRIVTKFGQQVEKLKASDYVSGVLVLNRGLSFTYNAARKITQVTLEEWYYLDVYVRRCGVIFPLFRVYHDSLGYWLTRQQYWATDRVSEAATGPFAFPDYNIVFMPWHTFAKTYAIEQSLDYLRPASHGWAQADQTVLGVWDLAGKTQIYGRWATRQSYSTRDAVSGVNAVAPPYSVKKGVSPGTPWEVTVPNIPEQHFPEATFYAAIFKDRLQKSFGNSAVYFGNDLVAVRLAGAAQSASLVGTRHSPAEVGVETTMDSDKSEAGLEPGWEWGAGDWAGDLMRQHRYYSEERLDLRRQIPQWGLQCKASTSSYQSCKQCMLDGPAGSELENMQGDKHWDMALDAAAGGGEGCLVGAWFGGWVGCIVGALAGAIASAVLSYMENERAIGEAREKYYSYCE
jgi:hypothetical protein